MRKCSRLSRRQFLGRSIAASSGLAASTLIGCSDSGPRLKQLLFVTEESNPKAQQAYGAINRDFETETGVKVVMEYPGFGNISRRVATLMAAQTPPELVWYGANTALEVALQGRFEDVDELVNDLGVPENMRLVVDGHSRSVPTSQQFCYGWYRSDVYGPSNIEPATDWSSYLLAVRKSNHPPEMYGNVIPSATLGASHILLESMFQKNEVHWFSFDSQAGEYEVALDQGENFDRAVETLEFLHEAHAASPQASNYNWAELMSAFFSGTVAHSYYVGARLLEQTRLNAPNLAKFTMPVDLPRNRGDGFYVSFQGFHVGKNSNVEAAKQYIRFFFEHPAYVDWLHSVPLHLIPTDRSILHSESYQRNDLIQSRLDVLEFIDSLWGKGEPPYLRDGPVVNPWTGLYSNAYLGGRMLAERNIGGMDPGTVVSKAADEIREKQAAIRRRRG